MAKRPFPLLSFRYPFIWLLVALVGVAWLLLGPRSETRLQLDYRDAIIGSVNGAALTLDTTGNPAPLTTTVALYTAPPETSQYYQAGEPDSPFAFLGALGAAIQTARPNAEWGLGNGTDPIQMVGIPLYLDDNSGSHGLIVPWLGARVASGVVIGATTGSQYAFVVRPERRYIGWWTFTNGELGTQLSSGSYRPSGWATIADLAQEGALALLWTAIFALLVLGIGWLLTRLAFSRAPSSPSPQRGEGWGEGKKPARLPRLAWATLLAVPAFALALWACLGPLEGIPHVQDDVAYVFQAKIFALGRMFVPAPPLPQFFEQGFIIINQGRWFAKYPPGFPLLLAPFELLHLDWLLNPLCAALTIALVYLIGRMIYGQRAAVWAALLGVVSPFIVFMSGSFMSHPATMLCLALFVYCFVRSVAPARWLAEPPRPLASRWAMLVPLVGGFAAGWAMISREATALGVLVPFVVVALADLLWAMRLGGRNLLRRFRAYGLMALGALPPLLLLALANWRQMGSPFTLAQELVGTYDRLGFGVGFGPESEGHSPAIGLYNALVYLRELQGALFGWPLLLTLPPVLLALFAAAYSWRRGEPQWRWDLLMLAGFLGLVGIYLAWWSSTTIFGPRYWYEGTFFLLLLAGRGIAWLGDLVGPHIPSGSRQEQRTWLRWLAPGLIVGLLSLYSITQYWPGEIRQYTGYNDVSASAVQRVAQAGLHDALVFVALDPAFPRRDYGKVFFANNPLLAGPVVYARDMGAEQNQTLLAQFPGRQAYYLPLAGPVQPGFGK